MRELKFRMWDKEALVMHQYEEHYLGRGFGTLLFHFEPRLTDRFDTRKPLEGQKDENLSYYEIMQYIGLKDKNGIEIYEGDVVKGVEEHKGQSKVFFDLGRYQPFSYLGTYSGNDFEVIGNVYENPELYPELLDDK